MILAALAWTGAAIQTAISLPFLIEVAAGLPATKRVSIPVGVPPDTVVLMPAHDEAAQIGAVLRDLAPSLRPGMRLLVVADNCGDDTAALARAAGAEVIERRDPARRGKGFALAFGRDHLRAAPPTVVIVLDADCTVELGALDRLAGAAGSGDPVQGLYLLSPQLDAPAMVQISSFAFLVKNLIRQRGLARMGAPLPLGGTGMAFPWRLFERAALASDHLVEDLALSVDLALRGHPARLVADAAIWSDVASRKATLGQRARWEGGFLQTARSHALPLIGAGLRRGRPSLVWMGLHVATPPLALMFMVQMALNFLVFLFAVAANIGGEAGCSIPMGVSILVVWLLAAAVLAAWASHGRRWLSGATLLRLPLYLLWKLPLYLRLIAGRGPRSWVRTERDG